MAKLTLTDSGETYQVPEGSMLLDYAQENGLSLQFGCTMGSCGVCGVLVESGMENLNPVTDEEKDTLEMISQEEHARLACQLEIGGDVSLRPVP